MKAKHIVKIVVATVLLPACNEPAPLSEEQSDYTETAFGLNMEMVYVEGGTFEMGGTEEQGKDANKDEYPVRNIQLNSYHIGKYEVTQAQWEAVMGTTIEEQRANSGFRDDTLNRNRGDDYPMFYIRFEEAQKFCKKLSAATGKKYVLPTEAQWEYAARGGKKSQHFKYAGSNDVDEVAWYGGWGTSETAHPVGMKKANELGIYDMSGNVSELCLDRYATYDESDTVNPLGGLLSFRELVMRGGDYYLFSPASYCRVSSRDISENYRNPQIGFRVACISK